jgi:hypothetical protein
MVTLEVPLSTIRCSSKPSDVAVSPFGGHTEASYGHLSRIVKEFMGRLIGWESSYGLVCSTPLAPLERSHDQTLLRVAAAVVIIWPAMQQAAFRSMRHF